MILSRLVNRYPDWARIRTDPSSYGQRMYSAWADYFDYAYAENKRLSEDYKLLKRGLSLGYVYTFPLEEEDQFTYTVSAGGEQVWTYPILTGTISSTDYSLDQVESIEELFWSEPTRLSTAEQVGVEEFLVYSDDRAGTKIIETIDYPAHLIVKIGLSLNFYKKTQSRNPRASTKHLLVIEGKDSNGSTIKERIQVRDDGFYWTQNIYTEIIEVSPEGFDGAINIYLGSAIDHIVDPFHLCITEDQEGPLKLDTSMQSYMSTTYSRLRYFTDRIKTGENYRSGTVEVTPNEIEKWEQYLLDSAGNPYTIVDIAINPNSTRLYALDTNGYVHVYNQGITSFGPPTLETSLTKTTYIEVLPVSPYALLGEDMLIFTRFTRIRFPIIGVTISRRDPSGNTEYLQANKTWSGSTYEWPGIFLTDGLPEDTWVDIDFNNEFDELGQWEFYVTTRTKFDTTVSYTGVMVDSLTAIASLDSGVTNVESIWFAPDDRIAINSSNIGPDGEANSIYLLTEYSDKWLPDTANQQVFLRETYDSVEVV